jgi:N-acetylglutamate synthase-like GNAT family acetyltransferase
VARAGAELCGTAGIETYGTSGLLRSVAVQQKWRGRGIARALCEEVMHRASAQQFRDLCPQTALAIARDL